MTDRELLEQALEALEGLADTSWSEAFKQRKYDSDEPEENDQRECVLGAITALRERLAQLEQSPLDRMAENARELGLDYEPVQHTKKYVTEQEPVAQQGCMRCNTPKKCALYGCSLLTWPAEQPEQEPKHDYRTRYDRGCYKCGSHYCPAACPEPTHLVPQQLNTIANSEAIPEQISEPVAVPQFRVQGCSDWYDGYPDYSDGTGAYETRTLYTSPQPAQKKPVAWMTFTAYGEEDDVWYENPEGKLLEGWTYKPLYDTTPPRREWVGLTQEEIFKLSDDIDGCEDWHLQFARAIEAKLREKNQ